jgi:hypothetical protein
MNHKIRIRVKYYPKENQTQEEHEKSMKYVSELNATICDMTDRECSKEEIIAMLREHGFGKKELK